MVWGGQGYPKTQGQVELTVTSGCLLKVIMNRKKKEDRNFYILFSTCPHAQLTIK